MSKSLSPQFTNISLSKNKEYPLLISSMDQFGLVSILEELVKWVKHLVPNEKVHISLQLLMNKLDKTISILYKK
jgi:hypothetical protein